MLTGIDLSPSKFHAVHMIGTHLNIGLNKLCDLSLQKDAVHELRNDQNPLLYNSFDTYDGARGCCQAKLVMDPLLEGHSSTGFIGSQTSSEYCHSVTRECRSRSMLDVSEFACCAPAVWHSPVPFLQVSIYLGGLKKLQLQQSFKILGM